jgi:hypothetical protein
MTVEERIDNLIEAGWYVLDSDFDRTAFADWRKQALNCVTALLGPSHTYTCYFRDFVDEAETKSLLTGEGILVAAKEQIVTTGFELAPNKISGPAKIV